MCKYITKDEQSDAISGRLWGCSASLSDLRGGESMVTGSLFDELNSLVSRSDCKCYKSEYFTCLYFNNKILNLPEYGSIKALLEEYLLLKFPKHLHSNLL